MKNKILCFISGVLVTIMVLCASFVAFGDSISKTVEVFFRDIKISIDGELIEPTDADGKKVEPFILDGTTYLPVRAVAETLGMDVEWDGETNTVFLGQKTKVDEMASLREFFANYLELNNAEMVTTMKDMPLFGDVTFVVKEDGNKTYTSGYLGSSDVYTEIIDGIAYLYIKDENGNWTKNVSGAVVENSTVNELNDAMYDVDNYVLNSDGIYEYVGDVFIEGAQNLTVSLEDDKCTIKYFVVTGGFEIETVMEIINVGTTTVILPEVNE